MTIQNNAYTKTMTIQTLPLQSLMNLLGSIGESEQHRRRSMTAELEAAVADAENPDALNKAKALREITGRWAPMPHVLETLQRQWILANATETHAALSSALTEAQRGMPAWRKRRAEDIGRLITARLLEGPNAPGLYERCLGEDEAIDKLEGFDLELQRIKSHLETFATSPSLEGFDRIAQGIIAFNAAAPWLK